MQNKQNHVNKALNQNEAENEAHKEAHNYGTKPLIKVVTVLVYSFFAGCLIGRQWLYRSPMSNYVDYYVPVYTLFQFVIYFGWLKVAEVMICPFGEDEDDFELNWIFDRNVQVGYMIVDDLYGVVPDLEQDMFWDDLCPKIPYTRAAAAYKGAPFKGSADSMNINEEKMKWDKEEEPLLSGHERVRSDDDIEKVACQELDDLLKISTEEFEKTQSTSPTMESITSIFSEQEMKESEDREVESVEIDDEETEVKKVEDGEIGKVKKDEEQTKVKKLENGEIGGVRKNEEEVEVKKVEDGEIGKVKKDEEQTKVKKLENGEIGRVRKNEEETEVKKVEDGEIGKVKKDEEQTKVKKVENGEIRKVKKDDEEAKVKKVENGEIGRVRKSKEQTEVKKVEDYHDKKSKREKTVSAKATEKDVRPRTKISKVKGERRKRSGRKVLGSVMMGSQLKRVTKSTVSIEKVKEVDWKEGKGSEKKVKGEGKNLEKPVQLEMEKELERETESSKGFVEEDTRKEGERETESSKGSVEDDTCTTKEGDIETEISKGSVEEDARKEEGEEVVKDAVMEESYLLEKDGGPWVSDNVRKEVFIIDIEKKTEEEIPDNKDTW